MNHDALSLSAPRIDVSRPGQQNLVLLLDEPLVIGRDCEGLLLADSQVSRRHVQLTPKPDGVEVTDLGSTNGSYLEGVPVSRPQLVRQRSRLLIGDTTVTIHPAVPAETTGGGFGRQTMIRDLNDLRATSIDLVADVVSSGIIDVEQTSLEGDTITIVFSDIESSTERATAMGDEPCFALLESHNVLVRGALHRFGGREVKSIGDGFMMVFPSVRRALRFVTDVQRRVEGPDGPDLRIRMGLHTGEAVVDASGDLFGRHVNLAARVANLACGGQVLASLVVREIAAGRDDLLFGRPAQVELKGFAELQTVYEVLWDMDEGGAT